MSRGSKQRKADPFTATRRKLERWRDRRSPGQRIPEALWAAALSLAREHGTSKTALSLRLDYYSLKKRLEATPAEESAEFVEVPLGALLSGSECIVELADGQGARLRIELKGQATSELASVVLSLWKGSR